MNSKNGAIPKRSSKLRSRLPSSDSENDYESSIPNRRTMSTRSRNRFTNSSKASTSQLDIFVINDSPKDIVSATNSSDNTTSKIAKNGCSMGNILELDEMGEIELAELSDMINKYENVSSAGKRIDAKEGSQFTSKVGKAALIIAERKAKASQSKIIDLRNKSSKQGTQRKCKFMDLTVKDTTESSSITVVHKSLRAASSHSVINSEVVPHGILKRRNIVAENKSVKPMITSDLIVNSIHTASNSKMVNNLGNLKTGRPRATVPSTTEARKLKTNALSTASIISTNKRPVNQTTTGSITARFNTRSTITKTTLPKKNSKSSSAATIFLKEKPKPASIPVLFDALSSPLLPTSSNTTLRPVESTPARGVILECPVCFEHLLLGKPTVLTSCGHMFCRSCMEKIQSNVTNQKCPICRTELHQIIDVRI